MSILTMRLLFIAAICSNGAINQQATTSPTDLLARQLAAQSLSHQARSLWYQSADASSSKVSRTLVLLEFARKLSPRDPVINRQLVDLYESLGCLTDASTAAAIYLDSYPDDYAMVLRWMRLTLAGLNTADERIGFLKRVVENNSLNRSARAAAAVELVRIYQGQGRRSKQVQQACQKALTLDPYQPIALRKMLELDRKEDVISLFNMNLKEFRGNPRNLYTAVSIAHALRAAGVYDKAIIFYDHACSIARDTKPDNATMLNLLVGYFNAMLDAGRVKEAVEKFKPYVKKYNGSLKLHALMVEAYRSLGQKDKANKHIKVMEKIYLPIATPGVRRSGAQAAELAWFNLKFRSDAITALRWAQEAARSAGDDPFVQRCLGAAEIANGKTDSGVRRLKSLIGKEPYAAVILARYHFEHGKSNQARRILLRGVGDIRTSPVWRAAKRLAEKWKINFPPLKQAEMMRKAVDNLPEHLFTMGRYPEKFVKVQLTTIKPVVRLAEPIVVEVSLKNISKYTIAVGQQGLFCPTVFLTIDIKGNEKLFLSNFMPVILPSPKYLKPGEKVSTKVRVDVGEVEKALLKNPFVNKRIKISGKVDLLELGGKMFSSVPRVQVPTAEVLYSSILTTGADEKAARYALGYIVRDLKRGTLVEKIRAARQCGAILGYVRRVERGKAKPIFPAVITKPILLSMTRAFLQADEPVIRAEMLLALHNVDLDSKIISLTARCIEDPSPLVRMRLIELLVVKKTRGYKTILSYLSYDRNRFVKEMTKALSSVRK